MKYDDILDLTHDLNDYHLVYLMFICVIAYLERHREDQKENERSN